MTPAQKGNILFPLISAIAVLAFVVAGYFVYQNQLLVQKQLNEKEPNPGTVAPPKSPNSDLKISNWKTITNSAQGYSFKIPQSWNSAMSSSDSATVSQVVAPDASSILIKTDLIGTKNLEDYLTEIDKISSTAYEGTPSKIILSSKNIFVAGQNAVERRENWPAAGFETVEVYVKNRSNVYTISIFPENPDPKAFGNLEAVKNFPQILSSFKFINQTGSNQKTIDLKVFFNNKKLADDPNFLECGKVFPVTRTVPQTVAVATAATNEWLKGPSNEEKNAGFSGGTNNQVKLRSVKIQNGFATVDLDFGKDPDGGDGIRNFIAGTCGTESFISQVRATLLQFPTIKEVQIATNGSVEEFNTWASSP